MVAGPDPPRRQPTGQVTNGIKLHRTRPTCQRYFADTTKDSLTTPKFAISVRWLICWFWVERTLPTARIADNGLYPTLRNRKFCGTRLGRNEPAHAIPGDELLRSLPGACSLFIALPIEGSISDKRSSATCVIRFEIPNQMGQGLWL